ncbi:MAG TPA: alpha/beta fold hydrolase, partial [Acidimicrobiales bacterium]|nr:alpha/beta fold hydrolase [Acidimicrobiales bacterium]
MPAALHDKVTEEPRWLGQGTAPLFGWLTWARGAPSRGGVLLAPPIGREARGARRALRSIALDLAARGFVTLRLDYEGTGDSGGEFDGPDRDAAWTASVAAGVAELRSYGVPAVSAIGMRLGATILAVAASRHDLGLSSCVLWDPCETGRGYLRQLRALEALRREVHDSPDGSVETAEYVFSAEAAASIRRLSLLTDDGALASRLLVVARDDRPLSDGLRARLGPDVDVRTTSEQGRLLDVDPLAAALPTRTMASVVAWLADDPHDAVPCDVPDAERAAHLVVEGASVVERFEELGPNHLFGVVTEPERDAGGPTMLLLNVAIDEHTGPSRLWVELARRWAAHGLRSVRFDLRGVGDSPTLDRAISMYDPRWLDDLADVTAAVADDASHTVLVGLCSGAYLAVEASARLGSGGVCAINPPVGIDFLAATYRLGRVRSLRGVASWLRTVALRLRWLSVAL